jgi:hypothetical protein
MTEYTRKIKGGLSEARPATSEIQEIADKVNRCTSRKSLISNQTFII